MVVQRKPNVQSSLVVFDLLGDFGPGPDLFFFFAQNASSMILRNWKSKFMTNYGWSCGCFHPHCVGGEIHKNS